MSARQRSGQSRYLPITQAGSTASAGHSDTSGRRGSEREDGDGEAHHDSECERRAAQQECSVLCDLNPGGCVWVTCTHSRATGT